MRVALFQAYHRERPYQQSLPPLGLGYLMAYLKRHCPGVEVFCCATEEKVLTSQADVVAISTTSENFADAQRLAAAARDTLRATIVVGGVHVTALPRGLPRCFDIGVVGEGEQTFVELIRLLEQCPRPGPGDLAKIAGLCFRSDGEQVTVTAEREPIANLDGLPYPDREGLGDRWKIPYSRTVHLISSRGCPYNCVFCASGRLWKGHRAFSAEYVAGEVAHVRERYNPREVHFFDDLFIVRRRRFGEFCRLLEQRGLHRGVVFRTHARADLIDEEMADTLTRLNFRFVDFGIESNCKKTLDYLGKRGVTPEMNQRAVDLLAERGLSIGVSIIIGSPSETREQIEETYTFLENNRSKIDRLGVGLLMPLPGTPVWDEAMERGLVCEEMEWDRLGIDFETADISRCPILSRHLDRAEMTEVFRRFNALEHIVNARGEVRQLTEENAELRNVLEALCSELESLKGSRAVRAAMKVRQLAAHLRGKRSAQPGSRL